MVRLLYIVSRDISNAKFGGNNYEKGNLSGGFSFICSECASGVGRDYAGT